MEKVIENKINEIKKALMEKFNFSIENGLNKQVVDFLVKNGYIDIIAKAIISKYNTQLLLDIKDKKINFTNVSFTANIGEIKTYKISMDIEVYGYYIVTDSPDNLEISLQFDESGEIELGSYFKITTREEIYKLKQGE
jgi:hypothetical protein